MMSGETRLDYGHRRRGRVGVSPELLLEQGYEVFGVMHAAASSPMRTLDSVQRHVELIQADLLDESSLGRCYRDCPAPGGLQPCGAVVGADVVGRARRRLPSSLRSVRPRCSKPWVAAQPDTRVCPAAWVEIFEAMHSESPQTEGTPIMPVRLYGAAKASGSSWSAGVSAALWPARVVRHPLQPPVAAAAARLLARKVANGAARISLGLQETLQLGDLEAPAGDWGYAGDYVARHGH